MVDSTGSSPKNRSKPSKPSKCSEPSTAYQEDAEVSKMVEEKEKEKAENLTNTMTNSGGESSLEKSPERNRSKSNQRWMKLKTTVQLSGAISSTNQKSKPPLKREDSFLKRFSTRQIPETQETVDTGDETETLNESHTQNEMNRHRRKKRREFSKTVINPDENFYFYWLMTVTFFVLYNLWTLIVRQSFPELQKSASSFWYSGDGLADVIFICDIVVQFRTGYLEHGLMVYNSKKLATHYLKSRAFILDILSLLPLDFLQINLGINPILRFPRFLKTYRVYNYYYMVESRTVYPNFWRVVNLIHILLILAHWFGCFYYLLSEAEGFQGGWVYPYRPGDYATLTRKYLGSLYWSTLTLTTIGDLPTPETNAESRGRSKAMTTSEQSEGVPRRGHKSRLLQFNSNHGYLFTIISYLIGVFIFATIVGQVGNVITNRNANRLEFERLLDGAKTYMRHHKVPGGMKRRVLRWYDYSWSRGRIQGGGDINTALGLLPDKLKTELALHVNLSVLKKVTIFQECQPEFLHDLVLKMKAYIFTPGDLICRKGEVAREMFIIADGILDVISETGRVLTTMKAGDFFGEIGILNLDGLNKRTADVRSVGYSELFSLSREDVLTAMKDYPEAQEILQSLGKKRLMEAKNAATSSKAQAKQEKDFDSSEDSDTARKRIVEKLRSDVKELKNALRRSRRGARTEETLEKMGENLGRKISTKNHNILKRMSHVQSSDECDFNDTNRCPIGPGLPVIERLKLVKEKQEKEREERERNKLVICHGNQSKKENYCGDTIGSSLPFTHRLKLLRQKEAKKSLPDESFVVPSSVRTKVTDVRFEKSTFKAKAEASCTENGEKIDGEVNTPKLWNKTPTEIGIFSLKEKFRLVQANEQKGKILDTTIFQEAEASSASDFKLETKLETSINVPLTGESENSLTKILGNKLEDSCGKDTCKLLKKSSTPYSDAEQKQRKEDNKLVIKVSKKGAYLSKSDTVLEKQKTVKRHEEKRSRSISPSDNSNSQKKTLKRTIENLVRERKKSRSMGYSPKVKKDTYGNNYWEVSSVWTLADPTRSENFDKIISRGQNSSINMKEIMKIKEYNSISDLSPEYSGLPFVKKMKILNERQKLEELEKNLLVRSASLDAPKRPICTHNNVLYRSQSEANTIEFKNIKRSHLHTEMETKKKKEKAWISAACYDQFVRDKPEPCSEFRTVTDNERKGDTLIHSEALIASNERNETIERRHLKSILKKLSTEDSTSDEDFTRGSISRNTDLNKLLRAPTIEGYAARRKKLTKSVTFDSDTLASSPETASDIPPDQKKEKNFAPVGPTTILTFQLSNLSMIPIGSSKKTNRNEEKRQMKGKYSDKEAMDTGTAKIGKITEKAHTLGRLHEEKENMLMPYILEELIEKNLRVLPLIKSLGNEVFFAIKAEIFQILQQVLGDTQDKMKLRFSSLQTELQNRDEVIAQLRSKIRELEIKSVQYAGQKSRTENFQQSVDKSATDPHVPDVPFLGGDSFATIRGIRSPSEESFSVFMSPKGFTAGAENSSKTRENYFEPNQCFYDYPENIINYADEVETKVKSYYYTDPTSQSACDILGLRSPDLSSDKEKKLASFSPLCSTDFITKKQKINRNYNMDETPVNANLNCIKYEKKNGNKLKQNFLKQVTDVQRSFSCSLNKTSDFVTLNIDDSSNSSDVEDLHHKDWEVQMLVKELARKDTGWKIEEKERCTSETEKDVEYLRDVRKLQKEVDTLKQMVCERDLTHLTASELNILETVIEGEDQKISQLVKSSSLDDDEKSKRQERHMYVCPSGSDNRLKDNDRRKKLALQQKTGQALSFDFHDIENRKPKAADYTWQRDFNLRKQNTSTGLCNEHKSLYKLWHTSSRLRERVFEDSDRNIKNITTGQSASSFRSSLPIIIPYSDPREKACGMRMSLPLLSKNKLRTSFPEHLTSSLSSFEEEQQETHFKKSCNTVFSELEVLREPNLKCNRDFKYASSSGSVSHSNGLNSFIRTVGQKMRHVMVGEANTTRNEVATISKLCDNQPILTETDFEVSDTSKIGTEVPADENVNISASEPFKIFEFDYNPKN